MQGGLPKGSVTASVSAGLVFTVKSPGSPTSRSNSREITSMFALLPVSVPDKLIPLSSWNKLLHLYCEIYFSKLHFTPQM